MRMTRESSLFSAAGEDDEVLNGRGSMNRKSCERFAVYKMVV